jgi:DNA invertase Pin-like site-specific DNA recombinase
MHSVLPVRAAQYLRMSTEHQQYSIENQSASIQRYADANNLFPVVSFVDTGKSGLTLKNRLGLAQLLQVVLSGNAQFEAVLVYDVSRWGRFQDIDESAHYEFVCRSAGIPVHYCTEPFRNDGTTVDAILKSVKRMMAGEYSRELSAKVFEGARNLASLGFRQGGTAGYGFHRSLVSSDRKPKEQLARGQRKSLQEDHVVLSPGHPDEIHCVREIFRMFTEEHKNPLEIANVLNAAAVGYPGMSRRKWYRQAVDRILKDPKYIGCNVYGRSTQKLGTARIKLPSSKWAVAPRSWTPLVDSATFLAAQEIFAKHNAAKSNQALLSELATVLAKRGRLSERIVAEQPDLPSQATYRARFGSLSQAFALAGYDNARLRSIEVRRQRRLLRDHLIQEIIRASKMKIAVLQTDGHWRPRLQLADGLLVSIYMLPSFTIENGQVRWLLQVVRREQESMTFIARLNTKNDQFQDYFLLPNLLGRTRWTLTLSDEGLKAGERVVCFSEFASVAKTIHSRQCSCSQGV